MLEVPVEEGVEQGVDGGVAVSQPGDDLEGAEQHRAGGVAASGRQPNVEHKVGQPAEHEHRDDDADGPRGLVLQLQVVLPLAVGVVVDLQRLRHDAGGLEAGGAVDEEVHAAHDREGQEKRQGGSHNGKNPVGNEDAFSARIKVHTGDLIPALHDGEEGNEGGINPDRAGHHDASAKGKRCGGERGSE